MGQRSRAAGHVRGRRGVDRLPLGALAELADLLGGDSHRSRRFLSGLVAGALAGAALAGSAMVRRRATGWSRERRRRG